MILIQFISGFMIGVEVQWDECIVFDVGIFRVIYVYGNDFPDKEKPA